MHVSEITDAQWSRLSNRLVKTLQKKPLCSHSEDLAQYALLKLWEAPTSFESETHLFHWCMKVAHHHALNQYRQHKRECVLDLDILNPSVDSTVDIYLDINRLDFSQAMVEWAMGHTLQDLSEKCGVSIPAVHKRLQNELKTMRTRLEC